MKNRCTGCDGEFMGEDGDLSFCSVCYGMTDRRTGRFYPAAPSGVTTRSGEGIAPAPPPDKEPFRQWDIEALARRYLVANRRLHEEYGVTFASPTGLPPLYDDLPVSQQRLLAAALAETIEDLGPAPAV